MSELFLSILNMSIAASWIVLAVLVLRFLLKKAPKWITVLLWAVVAIRLICPFTIESKVSLIPSAQTVSPGIMMDTVPQIYTGIPAVNNRINPIVVETFAPNPGDSMNPLQVWVPVAAVLWGIGILALTVYGIISYLRIKKKTSTAVLLCDNIFQSENVVSPFVLGFIRPKIYLPFSMTGAEMLHVIAHEEAHIRRKDHWWKPIGFAILSLHWFNPLMWLAYVLLCRDIELACDERVVKSLSTEERADYSQALLHCSVGRRMIASCPLAFGEVGVKDRVKSVLSYKKPAFWILLVGIVLSIFAFLCFLTNPTHEKLGDIGFHPGVGTEQSFYAWISDGKRFSSAGEVSLEAYEPLFDLDISRKGFNLSRSLNRDKSHTLVLQESLLTSDSLYPEILKEGHIYFNSDFTSVWFNNGIEPTVSYRVIDPDKAKELFERIEQGTIPLPIIKESEQITDPSADLDSLKSKFPMYFNLDLSQGLDLYIWNSENGTECFGLLPGNSKYTISTLKELYGSPAYEKEIQAIISQYLSDGHITRDSIFVKLFHAPTLSHVIFHDGDSQSLEDYRFWERYNNEDSEYGHPIRTITGNVKYYDELSNGGWKVGKYFYKYRLEHTTQIANTKEYVTDVYLSNTEDIPFEGVGPYLYLDPEKAVLVEVITGELSSTGADSSEMPSTEPIIPSYMEKYYEKDFSHLVIPNDLLEAYTTSISSEELEMVKNAWIDAPTKAIRGAEAHIYVLLRALQSTGNTNIEITSAKIVPYAIDVLHIEMEKSHGCDGYALQITDDSNNVYLIWDGYVYERVMCNGETLYSRYHVIF